MSDQPRILLVSERGLGNSLNALSFFEFEDVIQRIDHVDLVTPGVNRKPPSSLFTRLSNRARRHFGVDLRINDRAVEVHIQRDYDLLFFVAPMWSSFVDTLRHVRGWQEHCRKAVCWVHEIWTSWIEEFGSGIDFSPVSDFDHVIIGLRGTVPTLTRHMGRPCLCMPGGIDALRFCPYPDSPERVIDLYNMGRRSDVTHESLLTWAAERRRFYLYDTVDARAAIDLVQHRLLLADLLKRTQFFFANKAQVNKPEVTAGQDELGLRFFEGAAAGTVMIGDPPATSEMFNELFDWPDAVISAPFGSEDIPDLIAELERDPERISRIRRHNIVHSLTRFDWVYSWQKILEQVGLPPTEQMASRVRQLHQLAERASCKSAVA